MKMYNNKKTLISRLCSALVAKAIWELIDITISWIKQ